MWLVVDGPVGSGETLLFVPAPLLPLVSLPQHPALSQSLFLPLHGWAGFPAGAAVPLQKRTAVNNAGRVIKALSEPLTSRDAGW